MAVYTHALGKGKTPLRFSIDHEQVQLTTAGEVLDSVSTSAFAKTLFHGYRAPSGLLPPALRWVGRFGTGAILELPPQLRNISYYTKDSVDASSCSVPVPWTVVGLRFDSARLAQLTEAWVFARPSAIQTPDDQLYGTWLPIANPDGSVKPSGLNVMRNCFRSYRRDCSNWTLGSALDSVSTSVFNICAEVDCQISIPVTPPQPPTNAADVLGFLASQPLAEVLTWPLAETEFTVKKLMKTAEPPSARATTTTEVLSAVMQRARAAEGTIDEPF